MTYTRTAAQATADYHRSKEFEAAVAGVLPAHRNETESNTRLDFWVPGYFLDVKEKVQRLTGRWHLLPGVDEKDLFVIDEMTVRHMLEHFPYAYLLLRDVPAERFFIVSVSELASIERARANRVRKGKLIFDSRNFRQLSSLDQAHEFIVEDLLSMPWRRPDGLGAIEPKQV